MPISRDRLIPHLAGTLGEGSAPLLAPSWQL
jgi:hypothetical protein